MTYNSALASWKPRNPEPQPYFYFSKDSKNWELFPPEKQEQKAITLTKLRCLTYNIWFGRFYFKERSSALFAFMKTLEPDVICLQEVIPEFLDEILKETWLRENYLVSHTNIPTGPRIFSYGVTIFSKIPISKMYSLFLPSEMERSAWIAEYNINDQKFLISTVHLESLNAAPVRKKQLELISKVLLPHPNSILMGDFNFDSDQNFSGGEPTENKNIETYFPSQKFVDLWPTLYPHQKGYTFDTTVNLMLSGQTYERMRYDRIIFGSEPHKGYRWKPKDIKLLGTSEIPGIKNVDNAKVFPSDHFGLVADFVWETA